MICRDLDVDRALLTRQRQRALIEGRGPRVSDFIINNYSVAPPGDPYWSSVSSLLHFDGANASTTFTDEKGKTWTPAGNAQISTAQSVFGGASGLFDGSGDYISSTYSADFAFGTGEFTIEGRWRPASASVDSTLFCFGLNTISSGTDIAIGIWHYGAALSGKIRASMYVGATAYNADSTTNLSANTWYAWRYERIGATAAFYLNGTREANVVVSSSSINASTSFFPRLGWYTGGADRYANGYMDEFRITKGVARSALASSYVLDSIAFPNY